MKREDEKGKIKSVEEEEERKWKNRSFTWMELGVLYRLKAWVMANGGLIRCLTKTGWNRTQRILTPRQVGCIVEVLGEP